MLHIVHKVYNFLVYIVSYSYMILSIIFMLHVVLFSYRYFAVCFDVISLYYWCVFFFSLRCRMFAESFVITLVTNREFCLSERSVIARVT